MGGVVRDHSFSADDIVLVDDGTFIDCTFTGTILHYGGGEHPKFEQCTLDNVGWHLLSGKERGGSAEDSS